MKPKAYAEARAAYGNLPLSFEANQGQIPAPAKFVSHAAGYNITLEPDELIFDLKDRSNVTDVNRLATGTSASTDETAASHSVVRMKLAGANPSSLIKGVDELPGKTNYFRGNDPNAWRTGVSNYARVEYEDVYTGIDMVCYGNRRQLENDFVVAPGANPNVIRLDFTGASVSINAHGDLVLAAPRGEIRQQKPVVYQEGIESRQYIKARYSLVSPHEVAFEIAKYDTTKPLIIDPVFVYSTYIGSTFDDLTHGIAVDNAGGVYVTGYTFVHGNDAFVIKLNATGTAILYTTYLGSDSGDEIGYAIAVDAYGFSYVTGFTTSSAFPTLNPLQSSKRGWANAFVSVLNPSGGLTYSTFLGGSDQISGHGDFGNGIALDGDGNIHISGETTSSDFPIVNALQPRKGGRRDYFLAKLNRAGTALVFSTYVGGSNTEGGNITADSVSNRPGNRLAVDSLGNAYLAGFTYSTDFPVSAHAFQTTKRGESDVFIVKLTSEGNLIYATYLGGSGTGGDFAGGDFAYGIAVDLAGNAFVTGDSTSNDFPLLHATQSENKGRHDAFVVKVNASGTGLLYSTLVGGSGDDFGSSISVDAHGNAFVVGDTTSTNFPNLNALGPRGGNREVFIFELDSTGSKLIYSSYLGGSDAEIAAGIALDSASNAYVVGRTVSSDFPIKNPVQLFRTHWDGFITKIFNSPVLEVAAAAASKGGNGGSISVEILGGGFQPGATVSLKAAGQTEIAGANPNFVSNSLLTTTFDLRGAAPGLRDVVISLPDGSTATLHNGFTVEEGGAPQISVDIVGRDTIRPNAPETYTIVYENRGNVDAPVPVLELSSPDGVSFALFGSRPFQPGPFRIFAGGQPGSAGVLAPGSYSLQVEVQTTSLAGGSVRLDLSVLDATAQIFDWNRLANEGAPASSDPNEWRTRVSLAHSRLGDSLENVLTAMRNAATESGSNAKPFYDFDGFLRYLVGVYGATAGVDESAANTSTFAYRPGFRTHHAKSSRSWNAALADSSDERLVPIVVNEHPSETIVIFHGLGGLTGQDGTRTDFFMAAAAVANAHPNADVYLFDWTSGARKVFFGTNIPNPFAAAGNIDRAGDAAFNLLKSKSAASMTFIGESDGVLVMSRAAAGFRDGGLGMVHRALALDTPTTFGGYYLQTPLTNTFVQSRNLVTVSPFDLKRKVGEFNLLYQTTKTRWDEQHTDIIKALIDDAPFFLDLFVNPALHKSADYAESDGVIKRLAGLIYDQTPIAFSVDAFLNSALFPHQTPRKKVSISIVNSRDPNEKLGAAGVTALRYVAAGEAMHYAVSFENEASATASAQHVIIRDSLDISRFDLDTFTLHSIRFGSWEVTPPPGLTEFSTTVDLRPANDLIVRVDARLDKQTGVVTWRFSSLDPNTGLLTTDPLAGFLPPNTTAPAGEGSVFFTVSPKAALPTGTEVRNQASIIFDTNDPIETGTWMNTLDNSRPTSQVLALPTNENSNSFTVKWMGTDDGSGIKDYSLYVSRNGQPFTLWLSNVAATEGTFLGESGSTYGFFSIARDATENLEDPKSAAEATTQLVNGSDLSITTMASANPVVTGSSLTFTTTVQNSGPATASSVVLTDSVSAQLSIVSCSASDGQACTGSGNTRSANFAMLAPNSSETVTIVARIECPTVDGAAIKNLATVTSASPDSNSDNNAAETNVSASNPTPVIACPVSIVRATDAGMGSAIVSYPMPAVTDNCSITAVSCTHPSGTGFPPGSTSVMCTATDSAGAQSNCTFTVTVVDNEAPKIVQCAADQLLSTNGADQVTLPDYTREIVVTDNYTAASQLTVTQSPPAGTKIGAGTTPVTITVKDAAGNATTCLANVRVTRFALRDFVVFSQERTWLGANVRVITGNIGANSSLPDPKRHDDDIDEVEIGESVRMLQTGSCVVGDTLRIRANAQVQNVFFNELFSARGAVVGARFTPLLLPAVTMPVAPGIVTGTQNVEVQANQTRTLSPGRYQKIKVRNGGVLILLGGVYEISSLDLRQDADILFKGPAEVRIKDEFDTDAKCFIGPEASAPALSASQITFYVEGGDDRGRHHDEDGNLTPTAIQIGPRNTVLANMFAPNGTIWLKSNTKATGAFIGKRARIGEGVELKLASGF